MTEAEWLASDDPAAMLDHLQYQYGPSFVGKNKRDIPLASNRKLRLFACAFARTSDRMGDPTEKDFLPAIERSEKAADAGVAPDPSGEWIVSERDAGFAARMSIQDRHRQKPADKQIAASLLREIVGNPFRNIHPTAMMFTGKGTIIRIAQAIYDDRRFDDMPILADALEDAGCDNEDVLRHCRNEERCPTCLGKGYVIINSNGSDLKLLCSQYGNRYCTRYTQGPHVRGCWVLDLILGKE